MYYGIAASAIVVIHFLFVLFVVFGGLLVLKWPVFVWAHIPAVIWGALIEFFGWTCPLTPLENRLRIAGGREAYSGGFIEHYMLPLLYPPGLTRDTQFLLGALVVVLNVAIYSFILLRLLRKTTD
jgi:hypothetical protein